MEQEFKLSVYDVMQDPTPSGRTSEDGSPAGDMIRKLILDNWDNHEKISIYFDGIMKMTRPFCDEAFGRVISGMDVVDKIVDSPRDNKDNPIDRIEMKVTIESR